MIAHLNGQLVPISEARISPLDRGFIFGDGVYEGLRSVPAGESARGARIIGLRHHVRRMQEGLDSVRIAWDAARIGPASLELLDANHLREGFIYWQVTRGTPPAGEPVRSRAPARNSAMRPTVFGYCTPQPALASIAVPPVKRAVTSPDLRWLRGRLKSTSLMGNVMTALHADAAGCDEAVMVRELPGCDRTVVSEGLATNVVVSWRASGEVATPSLDSAPILAGVTRTILLRETPEIRERAIDAAELLTADEVILVGTTTLVTSVTHLDGRAIGDGTPGPVAKRLLRTLIDAIREGRDDA